MKRLGTKRSKLFRRVFWAKCFEQNWGLGPNTLFSISLFSFTNYSGSFGRDWGLGPNILGRAIERVIKEPQQRRKNGIRPTRLKHEIQQTFSNFFWNNFNLMKSCDRNFMLTEACHKICCRDILCYFQGLFNALRLKRRRASKFWKYFLVTFPISLNQSGQWWPHIGNCSKYINVSSIL